MNAWVGSPTW